MDPVAIGRAVSDASNCPSSASSSTRKPKRARSIGCEGRRAEPSACAWKMRISASDLASITITNWNSSRPSINPYSWSTRGTAEPGPTRTFPSRSARHELPRGMPEGDEIRQAIEVEGFFMKLWSYRSQFASGEGDDHGGRLPRRQISPLLIARTVRLDETSPPANPWPAWTMAAMVLGTVGDRAAGSVGGTPRAIARSSNGVKPAARPLQISLPESPAASDPAPTRRRVGRPLDAAEAMSRAAGYRVPRAPATHARQPPQRLVFT